MNHSGIGAGERQQMRDAIHRTAESPISFWPNLGSRRTTEIDPNRTYDTSCQRWPVSKECC